MTIGAIRESIQDLARAALPNPAYYCPVRYRVVEMEKGLTGAESRCKLQVVQVGSPYPDILPVTICAGIPGLLASLTPGCTVLVQFIEGDPSMPVVTHFADADDSGWKPVSMWMQADDIRLGAGTCHVATVESVLALLCGLGVLVMGVGAPTPLLEPMLTALIPAGQAMPLTPTTLLAICTSLGVPTHVADYPASWVTGGTPGIATAHVRAG